MELSQKEKQEIAEMAADILTKRSQSKIYDAIRVVLDIGRIDSMSVDQVKEARKVFDFIKQEREKALWNS